MMVLIKVFFLLLFSLVGVAFITLLERKVLSLIGLRVGPNKVSLLGLLQPMGDALKLMNKQVNFLYNFSYLFYYFSSFFMLFSALILWSCLFSEPSPISFKFSLLIFFLALGFNSLNSIMAGWSVFSKYSLIGSLRTVSQLISYEAVLYFCFFVFLFVYFSFNMYSYSFFFIEVLCFLTPWCFYVWFPSFLAELNRTPYDFSEGESELVSGFNTEFGSGGFTLIFLAEYSNILFFSLFSSFLFFFSYTYLFFFFFFFFVIWIRSVLPRFRFDKLMMLAWKFLIPYITIFFLFIFFYLTI